MTKTQLDTLKEEAKKAINDIQLSPAIRMSDGVFGVRTLKNVVEQQIEKAYKAGIEEAVRKSKIGCLAEVVSLGYALKWEDYEVKRLTNGLNGILDTISSENTKNK